MSKHPQIDAAKSGFFHVAITFRTASLGVEIQHATAIERPSLHKEEHFDRN
jgi:hypothetical protein